MRTLVTGASGFLGRHLVAGIPGAATLAGDVRQRATFENEPRADVVHHLAAQANVPRATADPRETWDVNANGTLQLLEWARRVDVGRVVLASSAHVYGPAQRSPIDETHPLAPTTPYGASKLAAEALARSYHATYGLDVAIVRPFNVYGPGQALGFLVPDIFHQVRAGKELVLGDPRPVRDFTYVADAAEFFRLAGTAKAASGLALNLGSGEGHAIRDVVELALRVSGSKLAPRYDPAKHRAAEIMELVVDPRAARKALGWVPKVSLEEGLRLTWEAMRA